MISYFCSVLSILLRMNSQLTELLNLCEDFEFYLLLCDIAKATVGQDECDKWFAERAGRISASKIKAAYHTSLHQSYVIHNGFTFLLRQQNGGVNMKVLLLGCKTWKNNILVFVSFIEDYAFKKNINFHNHTRWYQLV